MSVKQLEVILTRCEESVKPIEIIHIVLRDSKEETPYGITNQGLPSTNQAMVGYSFLFSMHTASVSIKKKLFAFCVTFAALGMTHGSVTMNQNVSETN